MKDVLQSIRDTLASLGVVDGVALSILLIFLIRGIMQGFVWQVATLAGVVGGLLAARALAPQVAPNLREWFSALDTDGGLDMVVAYFGVFVVVLLAVALIGSLLKEMISKLHLRSFDRLLGGLFGLLKAATLVVVAVSFLSLFDAFQEALAQSRTGKISGLAVTRGGPFFPKEVKDHIQTAFEDLEERFAEKEATKKKATAEDVREEPRRDPSSSDGQGDGGPDPAHSDGGGEGDETVPEQTRSDGEDARSETVPAYDTRSVHDGGS